jgi:transposase-like protein
VVSLKCTHCSSEQLIRDGYAPKGKQRYRCRGCGQRSREQPHMGYSEEFKAQIIAAYNERMSLRGIERTFGVSRHTVTAWLKKRPADERAEPYVSGADLTSISE